MQLCKLEDNADKKGVNDRGKPCDHIKLMLYIHPRVYTSNVIMQALLFGLAQFCSLIIQKAGASNNLLAP